MNIKTGDIFENKNGIRIGIVDSEPEINYVCFKIGKNLTKNDLDSAHFETRDSTIEGITSCLIHNGYTKVPLEKVLESIRLKEDDTQNQKQDDDQQQQQPAEEQQDNGVPVDPEVDSAEQVAGAAQQQQNSGNEPLKMPAAAPMPAGIEASADGKQLELADGTSENVAQDSSLQYNAINPEGTASISFKSGNFAQIDSLPQIANQKTMTITKTIIPLVEAGLIELLGNNKSFKGNTFTASFSIDEDMIPKFDVRATYSVEVWIGTDVSQEDIAEDANYLLERLKVVPDVEWRTCKIDCTDGSLELEFSI